jgi:glycosyltransferase involved in cell wall biosynthesis
MVAATCQFAAAPWQKRLGEDWVRVLYLGVPSMASAGLPARRGSFNIGVIGRICEQKGQEHVLDALRLLYREPLPGQPPIRCIIAGTPLFKDHKADDYFRGLQAMAGDLQRDFPDAPPVEFLGWVDPRWVLGQLDLLVVPSVGDEATTRVIPEAFSAGVPVIATRAGGIPELILDGGNGLLVDAASPEQIAQAVRRALDPDTGLGAMAAKALYAYEQELTLDRYHKDLIEFVKEAAAGAVGPDGA